MSLVGMRARNHPQQEVRDDVDDRHTPDDFFAQMHALYEFTVDAAASETNAKLPRYWTREQNGLEQSWRDESVWCNPPFSRLEPWLAKAWAEMCNGGCRRVVMLLPANRCEQPFWQRHVEPFRDEAVSFYGVRLIVRFLAGRMRFGYPQDRPRPSKGDRPPFGCVVLRWERA